MLLSNIGAYWDTRAEGYSISIHQQLEGMAGIHYQDLFAKAQPQGEHLNCLDIGCGPGFFSILLNRVGHQVTSLDYSEEMLGKAEANLKEMGFVPHTVRGDAQNLPFDTETFDLIVSRDLVWNLEDPGKAYREWIRVLKPGGRIIVSDGNYYLYYYDENYRLAKEAQRSDRHPCYGVDPTPINEIARELPLSKCLRPDWDVKTLTELGLKNIQVQLSQHPFTNPKTGEETMLIDHFELWGEK